MLTRTFFEGDDLDAALDKLRLRRRSYVKEAAYKTVDTFAGITSRKLWLRNDKRAHTDGHAIMAPFKDPRFYRLVEHELSHILFKSDAIARKKFVEEYSDRVDVVVKKGGRKFDKKRFTAMVLNIIGILEDHRCTTLWALLYPGSAAEIDEMSMEDVRKLAPHALHSLLVYIACASCGIDVDAERFERFKPFIQEAFRKVERRGFGATLLVAKWLVTQLVSELIRKKRDDPPVACPVAVLIPIKRASQKQPDDDTDESGDGEPQDSEESGSGGSFKGDDQEDQDSDKEDQKGAQGPQQGSEEDSDDQLSAGGIEDSEDDQPDKGDQPAGKDGQAGGDEKEDEGPKPGEWYPPPVKGDQDDRADALDQLMQDSTLGEQLDLLFGDFLD